MKKILSFILVTCFSVTLFGQTIVSTTPSNKNVILEEYTGTNCQYCPDGHKVAAQIMANNPGRAWALNIHQGGFSGNSPQYKTDWGNALAQQYGINSYPAATVNRGATWTSTRSQWVAWSNQILAQSSPVNVAAQGTIDCNSRHLTLLVEVYYTGNAEQATNKLNVAMLQNDIIGPQAGMALYPEMIEGTQYRHMHMLRDFITGQWGVDVTPTSTGSFWSHTFEYDIPQYVTYLGSPITNVPIVLEDLEFIVYIAENQKTILSGAKANISYVGLPNVAGKIDGVVEIPVLDCSSDANAYVKIRNIGQNPITSAEIKYTVTGGVSNTFVWDNRTIASMATDTVKLSKFPIQTNQNQNLTVELLKLNNEPITTSSKSKTIKKDVVQNADAEMKLVIKTDQYGSECSFKIFKPDGSILVQGGPFTNAIVEREFDFIPEMDGCYRLEVYDSYGDGMPGGYIRIYNSAETMIYNAAGNSYTTLLRAMVPVDLTPHYTITSSAGENGTIDPSGEKDYVEGSDATYIFTPDYGYTVNNVIIDVGTILENITTYTFDDIHSDHTIHVTFKPLPKYTISATAGANGTISPEGDIEFIEGESAEFIFTPDENYEIDMVLVDGISMEPVSNSFSIPSVTKDYSIHVTFKLIFAIKDVNGVTISIAPNPMNDKLEIMGMYDKLEIFSISGQKIITAFNQSQIDVTHLSKGVYFVKIQSNGQNCTFKVVK